MCSGHGGHEQPYNHFDATAVSTGPSNGLGMAVPGLGQLSRKNKDNRKAPEPGSVGGEALHFQQQNDSKQQP